MSFFGLLVCCSFFFVLFLFSCLHPAECLFLVALVNKIAIFQKEIKKCWPSLHGDREGSSQLRGPR